MHSHRKSESDNITIVITISPDNMLTLFGREVCMLLSSPVAVMVLTLFVRASPASTMQLPVQG